MAVSERKRVWMQAACQAWKIVAMLVVFPAAQGAEILKAIHVDHAFRYNGEDWEIVIHGNDGDPDIDPDEAVMVVIDQPFPTRGGRIARPPGEQWAAPQWPVPSDALNLPMMTS